MKEKFENALLDSGDFMRRAGLSLINNAGKAIALITLFVAVLVMFTDLSFADFGAKSFTTTVAVMLTASYMIYFSMEDTGEKAGEATREYREAHERYGKVREEIAPEKISELREFCIEYSKAELEFRRKNLLISYAESFEDFERFQNGEEFHGKKLRVFRRAARLRSIELSPRELLSHDYSRKRSELRNPDAFKFFKLALKLVPSTLCMLLTVSIIPSVKENLDASTVIEAILKLSSLPIIAFRGYTAGFFHARRELVPWIETKARLLSAFAKANIPSEHPNETDHTFA